MREEEEVLAKAEVDLLRANNGRPPLAINQLLSTALPGRSLDAIKGRRRRQQYKARVQTLLLLLPKSFLREVLRPMKGLVLEMQFGQPLLGAWLSRIT